MTTALRPRVALPAMFAVPTAKARADCVTGLVCDVIGGSMLFWTDDPEHAASDRVAAARRAGTAGAMIRRN